jgi:hypothetical protein
MCRARVEIVASQSTLVRPPVSVVDNPRPSELLVIPQATTQSTTRHADESVGNGGKTRLRIGQALTALVGLFLAFDAVSHLLKVPQVVDASKALGFDPDTMPVVGGIELLCLLLYLVPRTSVVGAVLLTGYLGGAVSAQLRIDAPLLSTLLFPVYVGVVSWAALWLRDAGTPTSCTLRAAQGVRWRGTPRPTRR